MYKQRCCSKSVMHLQFVDRRKYSAFGKQKEIFILFTQKSEKISVRLKRKITVRNKRNKSYLDSKENVHRTYLEPKGKICRIQKEELIILDINFVQNQVKVSIPINKKSSHYLFGKSYFRRKIVSILFRTKRKYRSQVFRTKELSYLETI